MTLLLHVLGLWSLLSVAAAVVWWSVLHALHIRGGRRRTLPAHASADRLRSG